MESSVTERGAITLPTIIAIVLGIGFCASAYLNYAQHARSSQDESLLQGQITDLKYQLNQQNGGSPSPSPAASPDPSASPSPSPSSSPAVAGTAVVPISQFGVKFTANDPITDTTYQPEQSGAYLVAAFTTQSLIAKYQGCHAGAIGSLVRKPPHSSVSGADTLIKNIGNYNFYYVTPGYYCAGTRDGENEIAQDEAQLKNDLQQSLTQQ